MSAKNPSFYLPLVAFFNGAGGGSTPLSVPWVESFDSVPFGVQVCVITQPLSNTVPGLYVLVQQTIAGVANFNWKFALAYTDVCSLVSTGVSVQLYLNLSTTVTFASGAHLWLNGQMQSGLTISPAAGGVWVVSQVAAGGISTLAAATDYTTAPLATANTSIANAFSGVTTSITSLTNLVNTKVTNVGTFANTGALQTAFPAAANTGASALVGSVAPFTSYTSNGTAWVPSSGGITTLAAATDFTTATLATSNTSISNALAAKIANLGTFASLAALQTAFPTGSLGQTAYVGSAAPYTQYGWNGTAWTGVGGGTPSTTVPNALGTAAIGTSTSFMRADAVIQLPTSGQINAFGIPVNWDPVANTQGLAAGVAPANNNSFKATQAGTTAYLAADGIPSVAAGDEVVFNGTTGHWVLYQLNSIGRTSSAILKGNGLGGSSDAVKGVDYMDAPILFIPVPLIYPSMNIGANGAFTLGYPGSTAGTGGGTLTFDNNGSTSLTSRTVTASLAIFAGTSADVGKVITLDGGKTFTVTAQSSTTVAIGTLSAILSTTSFAANTWSMALPMDQTYARSWVWVPAGAINGTTIPATAGFYYATWSSPTVGQLWNNQYTVGTDGSWQWPATPVAFSGTTGLPVIISSASSQTVASLSMPGNSLGVNGEMNAYMRYKSSSGAGAGSKVIRFFLGVSSLGGATSGSTSAAWGRVVVDAFNTGVTNAQTSVVEYMSTASGGSSALFTLTENTAAVDTTAAQTLSVTLQVSSGNGYDWIMTDLIKIGYSTRNL